MKVNGVTTNKTTKEEINRPSIIIVKKNENLTIIAKRYGMSKAEFAKWCNLNGTIKVGQKIPLPTATVSKGKGIYALAREYNMTMAEFSKMNGIKDPQNYKAKEGEIFYVKTNTTPAATQNKKANKNTPTSGATKTSKQANSQNTTVDNKARWGSSYSPKELGEKIFELSGKYYGAVGKPDFDALIKEINPKNVAAVIAEYTSNPKNKKKESLINTITSEISSKEQARKDTVMYIYDTLAATKAVPAEKREEFVNELNDQFSKWIGMVNTKKLDKIIQEVLNMPAKAPGSASSTSNTTPSGAANTKKVIVPESKYPQTVSSLQKGAIAGAKREALGKFKEYCRAHNIKYNEKLLDMTPFNRIPEPVLDKKGNIIPYVSELLKPTGKPNGKVIILNSGHGGYNRKSGSFDIGSYSFVKKANGKYAPHMEYEKVKPYVDDMANKLRAEGYSVVITQGEAHAFSGTSALTNLISSLQNGKEADKHKYKNSDIAFVSFHADSSNKATDTNDQSSVCYNPQSSTGNELAQIVNKNLNNYPATWVSSETAKRTPGENGVWVLTETSKQIPAVLLETAHINGAKGRANLDSSKFRQQFIESTLLGLNEYFGIK